jgi:hypothetical protein
MMRMTGVIMTYLRNIFQILDLPTHVPSMTLTIFSPSPKKLLVQILHTTKQKQGGELSAESKYSTNAKNSLHPMNRATNPKTVKT